MKKNQRKKEVYKLVVVAELTPPKGQEFVIDALSTLSTDERNRFTMDLIGGGKTSYIKFLKEKVKKWFRKKNKVFGDD